MSADGAGNKKISFIQRLDKGLEGFFGYSPIRRWVERHPVARKRLTARFSLGHFTGLPLTLLSTALIVVIASLLGIIQDYLAKDALVAVDIRIANLLYSFRSASLLSFFSGVTLFAQSGIIILAAAVFTLIAWLKRQRILALGIWVALIPSEGLTYVGKLLFHRARPIFQAIPEDSFSFPSGHATTVVAFYGFLSYLLVRKAKSWKIKIAILSAAAVLFALVDLSRLYLGVHYLSDVLAGDLVGLVGVLLAIGTVEWLSEKYGSVDWHQFSSAFVAPSLATVIIAASVLYAVAPAPNAKHNRPPSVSLPTSNVLSIFDKGGLPKYTETLTNEKQEPVNIIIVSREECLTKAFAQSGWLLADKVSWATIKKLSIAALFSKAYPTAPMTPSFFNTMPHDYGFEKQTDRQTVRARHHARFWDTGFSSADGEVYVGTASLDVGIKWGITHRIAPDIDTERTLLVADLEHAGIVKDTQIVPIVPPVLGSNFTGDPFFTDGEATVMTLKTCE